MTTNGAGGHHGVGQVDNDVKMYAAGFIEGILSAVRISEFYANQHKLLLNSEKVNHSLMQLRYLNSVIFFSLKFSLRMPIFWIFSKKNFFNFSNFIRNLLENEVLYTKENTQLEQGTLPQQPKESYWKHVR